MSIYIVKVTTTKEHIIAQKINELSHPDIKKAHCPESVVAKPVFPGYIFVDMNFTGSAYYKIMNLPFVLYFLSPSYGIFSLEKNETQCIKQENPSLIGLPVIITRGCYQNIAAVVKDITFPNITVTLPLGIDTTVNIKSLMLIEEEKSVPYGSMVKIISGMYAGLTGIIQEADNSTAKLYVDVFGTETLIECPVNSLEVMT